MNDPWSELKFKIGDLVQHRADSAQRGWPMDKAAKTPFAVIGQMLQRCPGGIQHHYKVTALVHQSGVSTRVATNILEIELEPFAQGDKP